MAFIKLSHRQQKALVVIILLMIFIYSIISISYSAQSFGLALNKKVDVLYSAFLGIEYVVFSLKQPPINEIKVVDRYEICPSGFQKLQLESWPGSRSGCNCDGVITPVKRDECWSNGCKYIYSKPQTPLYGWNNVSFCVARNTNCVYTYLSCPTGYNKCGDNYTCVPINETCPINIMFISPRNATPDVGNKTVPQEFDAGNYFYAYSNYSSDTMMTPIITIATINSGLPCVLEGDLPSRVNSSSYPLLEETTSGCTYYGSDAAFSTILARTTEADHYQENGVYTDFIENLPGYKETIENEPSYLTIRRSVKLSRESACEQFLLFAEEPKLDLSTLIVIVAVLDLLLISLSCVLIIIYFFFLFFEWVCFFLGQLNNSTNPAAVPNVPDAVHEQPAITAPPNAPVVGVAQENLTPIINSNTPPTPSPPAALPLPLTEVQIINAVDNLDPIAQTARQILKCHRCSCCFSLGRCVLFSTMVWSIVFGMVTISLKAKIETAAEDLIPFQSANCLQSSAWSQVYTDFANQESYNVLIDAFNKPEILMICSMILCVFFLGGYYLVEEVNRKLAFIKESIGPKQFFIENAERNEPAPAAENPVTNSPPENENNQPDENENKEEEKFEENEEGIEVISSSSNLDQRGYGQITNWGRSKEKDAKSKLCLGNRPG